MTRFKAFASHLGISLVIFLAILSTLIFAWFPPPFFTSDGGWAGIRIIAGVDLVLGPLLTFIVFKPGKPGLKFDLTVIGIIQLSALGWGIWMLHHERPVATVFAENYFMPVTLTELKMQGMTEDKLKSFGDKPPYWIYSDLPKNPDALQKVRINALRKGITIFQEIDYYKPLDAKTMQDIRDKSIDMRSWLQHKPALLKRYQQFLADHGKGMELVFLPWHARKYFETIALDVKTRQYVGTLDIPPPDVSGKYPMLKPEKHNLKAAVQDTKQGVRAGREPDLQRDN